MAGLPWSVAGDGVSLRVRLTPKADRDRIDGILELADGQVLLAARVRAVPEKGAANRALTALIAKEISVSRSSVEVTRGATARIKTLTINGKPGAVLDRLAALVG